MRWCLWLGQELKFADNRWWKAIKLEDEVGNHAKVGSKTRNCAIFQPKQRNIRIPYEKLDRFEDKSIKIENFFNEKMSDHTKPS